MGLPISLSSKELNYMIFRYFQESGLTHSAFSFGYEAGLDKCNIDANQVPPGALITFIQKGIQYMQLEKDLGEEDVNVEEDFQLLNPLDLLTKDVDELQKIIKEKKENMQRDKSRGKEKDCVLEMEKDKEVVKERDGEKQETEKEQGRERIEKEKERTEKEKKKIKGKEKQKLLEDASDVNQTADKINGKLEENGIGSGSEPMDICNSNCIMSVPCEFPSSDVAVLLGHSSEVFACSWNPSGSLLASGSGDSTARIWSIDAPSSSNMENRPVSILLRHFKGRTNEKSKEVMTLDWNTEGTLLATGSYDGQARIWARDGKLVSTLSKHKGAIFSLKWNKKGDYLLSGSVDRSAIVWGVKTGDWKQQFEFHSAPTLDVDWRNNTSFATCSSDGMIYVCKIGGNRPIKSFAEHQGEINAIKWDPTGSLLASCSDDSTAKIWSMNQDTCLLDFQGHTKEIYTVRWSPTGPRTSNPNLKLVLASASFDSTIKLWDVDVGRLLHSLDGHRDRVYSIAFSPNGEFLASGSHDRCLHIWSVKEARIVKTFSGNAGIFEVCWNKEGNKIAACFANNIVCVLDFRR